MKSVFFRGNPKQGAKLRNDNEKNKVLLVFFVYNQYFSIPFSITERFLGIYIILGVNLGTNTA